MPLDSPGILGVIEFPVSAKVDPYAHWQGFAPHCVAFIKRRKGRCHN